jgi:signal transduction histidine kinase
MTDSSRHPRRHSSELGDALIALGLIVLGLFDLLGRPFLFVGSGRNSGPAATHQPPPLARPFFPQHHATPLSYVLVVFAFAPLAVRRRLPVTVLAVVTVAVALYQANPNPPSIILLGPLIAMYTVGAERDRKTTVIAAVAAATVLFVASQLGADTTNFWPNLVMIAASMAVAATIGDATRSQRAYLAAVEQRAAEAERTRDEEARRRVDEERLRIARELHDVVAHSLSIIAVQSGAAAHVLDSDPAQARRSLDAIRQTSKGALDELRAMLGVLRAEGDADAPLAPVPGLSRIEDLAEPVRAAGYDVSVVTEGSLVDVPTLVDSSAYRVVQEALTNVVRHAGPCSVTVAVRREPGLLSVSVEDDGRGVTAAPSAEQPGGHGLAGMRERVHALGGTFQAGPRSNGGFVVYAEIPLGTRGDPA